MKPLIFIWLTSIILIYLIFSFVVWELNPEQWHMGARYFIAIIWLILTAFAVAYYQFEIKPQQR